MLKAKEMLEFLGINETSALVNDFADKTGKSVEEIENMWKAIKASLIKQGNDEESPNFYRLLVGIMKKNLGLIKNKGK